MRARRPGQASADGVAAGAAGGSDRGGGSDGGRRSQARHSLRAPVTDETFYFVMADRFENGGTANDTRRDLGRPACEHGFDPTNKGFYQGGDLKGLLDQIDYIQGLGTTSIWLTPSFKNKAVQLEDGPRPATTATGSPTSPRSTRTWAPTPSCGRWSTRRTSAGMKVYFDIITNHTADVIGYEEGARTAYVPKDVEPYRTAPARPFDDRDYAGTDTLPAARARGRRSRTPRCWSRARRTSRSRPGSTTSTLYHNRGNTTFVDEDSYYGDFFGLDDLFTEHPTVVNGMIDIYKTWIREMGIDGFRIDTMKHVNDEFWQKFGPEVLAYAKSQGKREFFMFGEVFDTTRPFTSQFTTRTRCRRCWTSRSRTRPATSPRRASRPDQLGTFFRQRRLVHRRGLQRLPAAHLPR